MQGEGKEKRKIIRSRHFLQRRIPTINCKCIPLHNQYGLTVAERFRPFESMAMPRLFPHTSRKLDMGRNNLKMESSPPKNVLDKSKMLLRKYLTRKDRFSSCIDIDPMYDWQFGSVEVNKYSTEKSRNSGRTSKTHKYRKSVGSIGP